MDTRQTRGKPAPEYLQLAEGKALTVRARRGTVVRSVQGRVWITQDGDIRDYVVPAGARYCAAGRGRIVVSAIDGDSRIAVSHERPVPPGLWARNAVRFDVDYAGTLENAARQAMADQVAAVIRSAWQGVRHAWHRLVHERVNMEAPTPMRSRGYHC